MAEKCEQNGGTHGRDPAAPRRFQDKVAVITGPSAYGIGGAIALRFAREGAHVVLLVLQRDDNLAQKLAEYESQVQWVDCDVTNNSMVVDATRACLDRHGRVDILVNNAGVESTCGFAEMPEADWQQTIDVNLSGVIRVCQAMLPSLEKAKGVVINISSATSYAGTPGLAAYGASKAGVNALTEALAIEYASRRVRVVGVAPAVVRTPMIVPFVEKLTADDWQQVQACHPLGIGVPEDVASAVAFLASDEARWISGMTLPLGWIPNWPMPNVSDRQE